MCTQQKKLSSFYILWVIVCGSILIQGCSAQRAAKLGEIKDQLREFGVKSLLRSGIKKAEEGLTSIEEVLSITLVIGIEE